MEHADSEVMLAVAYLVSYEHMGRFSIQCVAGCQCAGVHDVSATHTHHTSVEKLHYFTASQHGQCRLKVTSQHDDESGGDKVKIDALMVSSQVSTYDTKVGFMNLEFPEDDLIVGAD